MFQRVFAAEFNAAAVQFPGKDLAEPAVLTPGGAVLSLVFCSGALLECLGCGNETVHARMADPTGAFSLQADPHSADARTTLCSLETPCFVTVIGKPFLAGQAGLPVASSKSSTSGQWIVTRGMYGCSGRQRQPWIASR